MELGDNMAEQDPKKIMIDRLLAPLWVPVLVITVVAVLVVGIGELLLALAEVTPEVVLGGIEVAEPWSVLVAMLIAIVILAGGAILARRG